MTTLAPVGVLNKYDAIKPTLKQITEMIADEIMTWRKFLKRCILVRHGKIIRLDINNDPSNFIPITTTMEQIIARMA